MKKIWSVMAMVVIVLGLSGVSLAATLRPLTAEEESVGKWWSTWETIETQNYRLNISVVGDGALFPNDEFLTGGTPRMLFVIKGVSGIKSQLYRPFVQGKIGAWEEGVTGERKETAEGTEIKITGEIEGIEIEQNILATKDTLTVKWQGEIISPSVNLRYVRFSKGFHHRPEGLIFRAETKDGSLVSGDLCQRFENIKSLKWLEVKTAEKLVRFEFPEAARVDLESTFRPDHRHVASIYLYPEGVKPWASPQPGDELSYTMKIKVTPL